VIIDLQMTHVERDWPLVLDSVLAAQGSGFDAVWALDHLSGDMFGASGVLECFTLLGALASVTSTLRLGSLVANVANRHPGLLAVSAASVQAISGGRLLLGLGAGTSPHSRFASEQNALGIEIAPRVADRHGRVQSTLDTLDAMWAGDRDPRWDGFLRPEPRPPVIVGLNSHPLAALAGRRADGMNVRWNHPELEALLETGRAAFTGRPGAFSCSVWLPWDAALVDPEHPERQRLAACGVDRLILSWFRPPDPDEIAKAVVLAG
jgi:alkanesulfonate monooxygenase SsuD/methylene tetrahydromethanopterin reductase-like flavin-dependent oxidoreductase (luciferase family)